ncbi:toll/interleukin-1 receptor domain-containing protein [Porphyrobacter sp. GA68]|uniref:tetratricopeptide repeat protein n=1 Tax=Porphyrobacter sp. GA68 TaxID=2883480 RepID=UPI001D1880FF|nr:toll/interleukin-1 receptor domain-containing protein [Porphyrobacter sp. GA68]
MAEGYSAFISYSHADTDVARWLHRAIEGYRFPSALLGADSRFGAVPRRLPPVFRDREELPASGDLGAELRAALSASRFQIVICSPHAARSRWVNEEIRSFKQEHGEHRTLALIAAGEPYSGGETECFPDALRYRLLPGGALSDIPAEPIAADIRPGKDGRRLALLKLLAGLSGLPLDALARRDHARRQRRMMAVTAASSTIALVTIGLAIYAEGQRRVAVEQRDLAESSLDFLVRTFEIANPATENPRTITALTILDRASSTAGAEFTDRPAVAARLLRATGDIYFNLGLLEEAERDLGHALRLEPGEGQGRAETLLKMASVAMQHGDAGRMAALVAAAQRAGGSDPAPAILADIAQQRAALAALQADYQTAASGFAEAARAFQHLPGDRTAEVATNLMRTAFALVQLRQYGRADALFTEAAELLKSRYGLNHVKTAQALQNQAFASLTAGSPDAAAAKIAAALRIYQRVLEPGHPTIAQAELLMGRILAAQNNHAAARQRLAAARQLYAALYGQDNPAVADVDFYAAEMEAGAGRTAEALRLAGNVKRIYDAAYGADDPDQAELLLLRARIYRQAGADTNAAATCRDALALQRRIALADDVLRETDVFCQQLEQRRRA